ncbi:MAG: lipid-A-disaccharide synthase, partial [Bryobacterales bacterium]|nr:lipid-A-disaccharide synthase [Bryobacterales bacterium]
VSERVPSTFILATPRGTRERLGDAFFRERIPAESIQVIEGETWDVLAHADVALTASGTVTMEAALLGTPMVTYYKVTALSWLLGRFLVKVPFYSMVNLIAERRLATELMQNEMTGPRLAQEALRLLESEPARAQMKRELAEVAQKLSSSVDPMERAAGIVREFFHAQR